MTKQGHSSASLLAHAKEVSRRFRSKYPSWSDAADGGWKSLGAVQVATRDSFHQFLSHLQGQLTSLKSTSFFWVIEVLSRIPNRELSFARLIPHNSTQLLILLPPEWSTSDPTPVGSFGLKKLRLSRQFASTQTWELYPDKCRAAYEELMNQYSPQHGILLSLDARVARPTFSLTRRFTQLSAYMGHVR